MKAARANRATSQGGWVSPRVYWGTTKIWKACTIPGRPKPRPERVMSPAEGGAGDVRPGKPGDSAGRTERRLCSKASGHTAASQDEDLGKRAANKRDV